MHTYLYVCIYMFIHFHACLHTYIYKGENISRMRSEHPNVNIDIGNEHVYIHSAIDVEARSSVVRWVNEVVENNRSVELGYTSEETIILKGALGHK